MQIMPCSSVAMQSRRSSPGGASVAVLSAQGGCETPAQQQHGALPLPLPLPLRAWTVGCSLWTVPYSLWTVGSGLWAVDCERRGA